MKASLTNPIYTFFMIDGSTKYDLTPAVISFSSSDQENQMALNADINLANIKVSGKLLSDILQARQRVFIYADDGTTKDEVFRGWIWTKYADTALATKEIHIKCYDNMIYFQESEDSKYFSDGTNTRSAVQSICNDWGITLNYSYSTITHSKLVLRGTLSNILTTDILDVVKARTGRKYVINYVKDVLYIKPVGQNSKVYNIEAGDNAVRTRSEQTMDGMVTKVVILGKADDQERKPVEASVSGNTAKYGTLQKLQDRDENTSLADAQAEARTTIDQNGSPFWLFEVDAPDIPWIRKGDKVHVTAGDIDGNLIVRNIDRSISAREKSMSLTLEWP